MMPELIAMVVVVEVVVTVLLVVMKNRSCFRK